MADYGSEGVMMVDAIEDGKIVRVSESYARREGLVVLRNHSQIFGTPQAMDRVAKLKQKEAAEKKFGIDTFRKPLNYRKNQVINELVDNFHWQVISARKSRNLSRKQLGDAVGVSENVIKTLENGLLPSDDFILISKVEAYLKLNLRKDGKSYNAPKLNFKPVEPTPDFIPGHEFKPLPKEDNSPEEVLRATDGDIEILDD